eukprot:scaffold19153_cov57-Phaeocystis_antarctica.AAC.2
MLKTSPVEPASAALPADWPRLALARGSLGRDLTLREASGVLAGGRLSHPAFDLGSHIDQGSRSNRVARLSRVAHRVTAARAPQCGDELVAVGHGEDNIVRRVEAPG